MHAPCSPHSWLVTRRRAHVRSKPAGRYLYVSIVGFGYSYNDGREVEDLMDDPQEEESKTNTLTE